jgi:hypothetical protein
VTDKERELDALRTEVASQAASLAQTVSEAFEGFHLGAGDWVVELMTAEGPSTGGGRQALQHLRLAPRRKGYATVVVGSVDPVARAGEIRTFEHVAILHELRFQRPLEITPDEYDAFLKKLDLVMNLARVRGAASPPSRELVARRRAKQKLSTPAFALFRLVMVLAAIVVYRVARVLAHGPS